MNGKYVDLDKLVGASYEDRSVREAVYLDDDGIRYLEAKAQLELIELLKSDKSDLELTVTLVNAVRALQSASIRKRHRK